MLDNIEVMQQLARSEKTKRQNNLNAELLNDRNVESNKMKL